MNCKQGDLAIIVRSYAGNEGKIIRCVRHATEYRGTEAPGFPFRPGSLWEMDRSMQGVGGGITKFVRDDSIRPIRDTDGTDESLIYAPLQEKETT